MSFVNFDKKEINFKIVYYGAPLCGKTTNLAHLHSAMPEKAKGELTMLSTQQDRTLYFDFLLLRSTAIKGFVSRFQLYTVSGQPIYDKTRRIVLTGADGIVFVADSQWSVMPANAESLKDLRTNLASHNRSLNEIPYVFQLNKRDLDDIAPVPYLEFLLNHEGFRAECFEAVAIKGEGVTTTLNTICKMVMADFIKSHEMEIGVEAETSHT